MGMVSLVGELFERFQVEVGIDELQSCDTVADLITLVRGKSS
jgi:acyl carrier protein